MVERLHRQGRRAVLSKTAHPLVGDAAAHLNEAVEPAPAAPWSGPAVGVERDIDQPWPCFPARFHAEPQAGERVRSVAVHQHVRPAKQAKKPLSAIRRTQVETGAALAQHDFGNESGLVPPWRVNAQDLRSETCQEPCCDRARKNTRQV